MHFCQNVYTLIPLLAILILLSESKIVQQYRLIRQTIPSQSYGPPCHVPGTPLGSSTFQAVTNGSTSCPPNDPQQNKRNVVAFYEEMFGKKNFASIETYIGPMYIQHNPFTLDGKDKLLETLNGPFWSKLTGYKIYRISAEDDLVWVHDRMDFGEKSYVFLDILRFECGKIVEHWDVIQEIKGNEINPKAFF